MQRESNPLWGADIPDILRVRRRLGPGCLFEGPGGSRGGSFVLVQKSPEQPRLLERELEFLMPNGTEPAATLLGCCFCQFLVEDGEGVATSRPDGMMEAPGFEDLMC